MTRNLNMTRVLLLLTISAPYFCFTSGQSACSTPIGGNGTCKLLEQCPPVMEIIKTPTKTQQDLDWKKKYHCGLEGNTPKVCCPDICKTPDNEDGLCVSIHSCPLLAKLLEPPLLKYNEHYVLQSQCINSQEYSVCCPLKAPKSAVPAANCSAIDANLPPDPRSGCCGVDTVKRNDVESLEGGKVSARTTVDQYPWMALIEYIKDDKARFLCLGALISQRYLLTTAHCVIGRVLNYGKPTSVRLGEYDTENDGADCAPDNSGVVRCTDGMVRIGIEKTIPYPAFIETKVTTPDDIALVKLKQDAPFTDFIRPICLPNKDVSINPPDNLVFYATGWGASVTKTKNNVKLQVDLPFVAKEQCQSAYQRYKNAVLTAGQICAGGVSGKDTCKGDTGGPLMYYNGDIFEAVGIVSFGPSPCGQPGVPGVYTHVYEYIPWILNTINIDVTLGADIK